MISEWTNLTILEFIKNFHGNADYFRIFKDSECIDGCLNQEIPEWEYVDLNENYSDLRPFLNLPIKEINFTEQWVYDNDGFEMYSEDVIELYI